MKHVSIKKDYIPPSLSMSIVWHEDSISTGSNEVTPVVNMDMEINDITVEFEKGIDIDLTY